MEIILAIVVAVAVIFFGALVSMGNERQRKAIDGLREQVVLWAVQDLKIKREVLKQEIRLENPLGWLSTIASKAFGVPIELETCHATEGGIALIGFTGKTNRTVFFSQYSPVEIRKMSRLKRDRLSRMDSSDTFLGLAQNIKAYQMTTLNNGMFFDLELQLAWRIMANQVYGGGDIVWVYLKE